VPMSTFEGVLRSSWPSLLQMSPHVRGWVPGLEVALIRPCLLGMNMGKHGETSKLSY
jgi:hypothetical protein